MRRRRPGGVQACDGAAHEPLPADRRAGQQRGRAGEQYGLAACLWCTPTHRCAHTPLTSTPPARARAPQHYHHCITEISNEELERVYATNIWSFFYLSQVRVCVGVRGVHGCAGKVSGVPSRTQHRAASSHACCSTLRHDACAALQAAIEHMQPGSAIVNCSSVTAYVGYKDLLDYATTKGRTMGATLACWQPDTRPICVPAGKARKPATPPCSTPLSPQAPSLPSRAAFRSSCWSAVRRGGAWDMVVPGLAQRVCGASAIPWPPQHPAALAAPRRDPRQCRGTGAHLDAAYSCHLPQGLQRAAFAAALHRATRFCIALNATRVPGHARRFKACGRSRRPCSGRGRRARSRPRLCSWPAPTPPTSQVRVAWRAAA